MYEKVTLEELKRHDYYGWIGTKCTECSEQFYADTAIYNLMETNDYICQRCHDEVAYNS